MLFIVYQLYFNKAAKDGVLGTMYTDNCKNF